MRHSALLHGNGLRASGFDRGGPEIGVAPRARFILLRDSARVHGNGLRRNEIRHARVLAILPRAAATDFSAVLVPVISIMASGIARGRERTTRIARVVRTRPSGSTTAARSA